ncbi:MAG: FtsQ-type POTRA domain-containing protein [Burkholderiaceae bacterium]
MNIAATVMAVVAALVLMGGALFWLAQRPVFDLRTLVVEGDLQHVTAPTLRAALAGRVRGNYFTVSLDEVRRTCETVPWVAEASVRRVWPDRLLLELREHRALGVWSDGRLLSDEGRLFVANAAEADLFGALPEFTGPAAAAPEATRRYYQFAAQVAPLGARVTDLDVSERASWSLVMAGETLPPTRIELGRDSPNTPVVERLERLVAQYPMVMARLGAAPIRLDARYSNGFAAALPAKTK